jgi:hypothetical protein
MVYFAKKNLWLLIAALKFGLRYSGSGSRESAPENISGDITKCMQRPAGRKAKIRSATMGLIVR